MNAPIPFIPCTGDFESAIVSVNQWRGSMIEGFARAEMAASELLLMLVERGLGSGPAKLPHPVGHRYDALAGILSTSAPPPAHAEAALAALETFRRHETLRNILCHGETTVTLERRGRWIAIIEAIEFRPRLINRSSLTVDEAEAVRLSSMVSEDRRRLLSALGQVRKSVGGSPHPSAGNGMKAAGILTVSEPLNTPVKVPDPSSSGGDVVGGKVAST